MKHIKGWSNDDSLFMWPRYKKKLEAIVRTPPIHQRLISFHWRPLVAIGTVVACKGGSPSLVAGDEVLRGILLLLVGAHEWPDGGMRADVGAVVALRAVVGRRRRWEETFVW